MSTTTDIVIYSGGNPYGSTYDPNLLPSFAGAYTTVVLWALRVDVAGTITMNDGVIVRGGQFVAAAEAWAAQIRALKSSGVRRVGLSFISFAAIKTLMDQYGDSPLNPLYQSLQLLIDRLHVDFVDYDDESVYDAESSVAFAQMCATLGLNVTLCPYTYMNYWTALAYRLRALSPELCSSVFLQCYSGGAGNDPASWNDAFAEANVPLTVTPGCTTSSPKQVVAQVAGWKAELPALGSAFIFVGTSMTGPGYTPRDYAEAIASGLVASSAIAS